MENADYEARLERLDRDLRYFQRLLRGALPQERLEIHRQILAIMTEKRNLIRRQTERRQLENERMARALEVLERMRNNWREPFPLLFTSLKFFSLSVVYVYF